jgi:outer membrane receptor protein involved in Fe transport
VFNADAGYQLASGLRIQVSLLNLFNTRASDIQYYYASRLQGEPSEGVDDVHFHPVEPRQIRASLSWGL